MKQLLKQRDELVAQHDQLHAAIDRAAADTTQLAELEARSEALRASRQDKVAGAFLANTTPDLTAIDAELTTLAAQITTLSDAGATHALLSKQLANVGVQLDVNQANINKIIADRMQDRFEQAEKEFTDAVVKLGDALIKMQSALIMTRLLGGNNAVLRDQYRNYVGDGFYVKGLTRMAERDVLAEAQAAEMLENLKSEGVTLL